MLSLVNRSSWVLRLSLYRPSGQQLEGCFSYQFGNEISSLRLLAGCLGGMVVCCVIQNLTWMMPNIYWWHHWGDNWQVLMGRGRNNIDNSLLWWLPSCPFGLRSFQDFYQLSLLIQSLPWRGTTFKISNHIPDCISDDFATSLQPLLPVEFHFLHILWTNLFVKSWIKSIQFYYLSTYILSNSL